MKRQQTGFTLMEAIVALVLMATTGMALFSWVNSNIIALQKVQTNNLKLALTLNALEYLRSVNPMETPNGDTEIGRYKLHWKSEPLAEARDGAGYPTGISLYQIGVFQTIASLTNEDGKEWFSFRLQQVGYKRVREIRPPI